MFKSGFPGTTFIDFLKVMNALVHLLYKADGSPAVFSDLAGLKRFSERCMVVFAEHGMTLHADTQGVHLFLDTEGVYVGDQTPDVKVLGQQIVARKFGGADTFVPLADKDKLFASLVRPANNPKESQIAVARRNLARCMGLTVSGGFMFEDFYSCARYYYEKTREQVKKSLYPFDQSSFDDVAMTAGYEFPEVMHLFMDDEMDEKTGVQTVVLKPFPPAYLFMSLYTGITPLDSDVVITPLTGKFVLPGADPTASHAHSAGIEEEVQEPHEDDRLQRSVVKVKPGAPAAIPYDINTVGSLAAEPAPRRRPEGFKALLPEAKAKEKPKRNIGSAQARAAVEQRSAAQIQRTLSTNKRVGKGGKLQQALAAQEDFSLVDPNQEVPDDVADLEDFGEDDGGDDGLDDELDDGDAFQY
jgi:hypothetical protein